MKNIIQQFLNPDTKICTLSGMYFKTSESVLDFDYCKKTITLKEDETLTSDTYFNSFSYSKWFKYTNVSKVYLEVEIKGEATVSFVKTVLSDGEAVDSIVDSKNVISKEREKIVLSFDFSREQFEGIAYAKIVSKKDNTTIYNMCYSTEDECDLRDIKLSLVVCTFKREKYIYNTIDNLKRLRSDCKGDNLQFELFVIDNGKTLDKTVFDDSYMHLIQNKNAGGAAGFTRGIISTLENGTFTHVILMDDDALMDPQIIVRTNSFLKRIKQQYEKLALGGATLRLDRQNMQLESGAVWNNNILINLKRGIVLDDKKNLILNEKEESKSYNAWVYCCIPTISISSKDLPLPLFVRGDDMEYGIRHKNGIISLNGIGLWHAPVDGRYSFFMNYYMTRNQLILNALYDNDFDCKKAIKLLKKQVRFEIERFRYENVDLTIKAFRDFLGGVDFLLNNDGEKLHKEVLSLCPKMKDYLELEKEGYPFTYQKLGITVAEGDSRGWKKIVRVLTLSGYLLPNFLKRKGPLENYGIVDLFYARVNNFYRRNCVLQIDTFGQKGVITKRSFKRAFSGWVRTIQLCILMKRGRYSKAVRSFKEEVCKVQDIDFWKAYLNIEEGKQ